MKKNLLFLITTMMLLLPVSSFAQKDATIDQAIKLTKGSKFLEGNFKVTKPLFALTLNGKTLNADQSKHKVTLEVIDFGVEGNTVLMTLDLADQGKYTYTWSGNQVKLAPGYDNGVGLLTVLRGNTTCGIVGVKEGNWLAILLQGGKTYTISDFKKGMTRSEVEDLCSELGLSQFKFTRNSGKLKVYSLFWLDMQKRDRLFGDYYYEMRNDKKYGDFYFDEQGKLVKWFLYM